MCSNTCVNVIELDYVVLKVCYIEDSQNKTHKIMSFVWAVNVLECLHFPLHLKYRYE